MAGPRKRPCGAQRGYYRCAFTFPNEVILKFEGLLKIALSFRE